MDFSAYLLQPICGSIILTCTVIEKIFRWWDLLSSLTCVFHALERLHNKHNTRNKEIPSAEVFKKVVSPVIILEKNRFHSYEKLMLSKRYQRGHFLVEGTTFSTSLLTTVTTCAGVNAITCLVRCPCLLEVNAVLRGAVWNQHFCRAEECTSLNTEDEDEYLILLGDILCSFHMQPLKYAVFILKGLRWKYPLEKVFTFCKHICPCSFCYRYL